MPSIGEPDGTMAPPPYASLSHSLSQSPAQAPTQSLTLDGYDNSNAAKRDKPTATRCATHLKLLHAFARLRREVGCHEGLFGIFLGGLDAGEGSGAGLQGEDTLAERLREKRWSVFASRAVDRFKGGGRGYLRSLLRGSRRTCLTARHRCVWKWGARGDGDGCVLADVHAAAGCTHGVAHVLAESEGIS